MQRLTTVRSPSTKIRERKEVKKGNPVPASASRQFIAKDGETLPIKRAANLRGIVVGTETSGGEIVDVTKRFDTVT